MDLRSDNVMNEDLGYFYGGEGFSQYLFQNKTLRLREGFC